MPMLTIEILGRAAEHDADLAARLADAAASALESRPGGTWVRVHWLEAGDYAEDGGGPPPEVRPVFVSVIAAAPPQGAERARQVAALTVAIAEVCDRPADHVHLIYEPPALGRVAFGGRLVGD